MKEFRIYKPRTTNDGAASAIQIRRKHLNKNGKNYAEYIMFWIGSQQTGTDDNGNAKFEWTNKAKTVTLKMSEVDCGELLAVLHGKKEIAGSEKGIFHKNANGSSALVFKRMEKGGYSIRLSFQNKDKQLTVVQHLLTLGEGEILEEILLGFVRKKFFA